MIIEICGHFILRSEIVGIGPLMAEYPMTQENQIYNYRTLYFMLHLKLQSIKIVSKQYVLGPSDMKEVGGYKEEREEYLQWKAQYEAGVVEVKSIID